MSMPKKILKKIAELKSGFERYCAGVAAAAFGVPARVLVRTRQKMPRGD